MEISFSELKNFELLKIMSELSVIKDRLTLFRNKYSVDFTTFEISVKAAEEQDITKWDDYIEWKAYEAKFHSLTLRLSEIEDAVDFKITKD